jgi:hypothetical protein
MIRVTCPGCNKKFQVDDSFAGKSGRCPSCKSPIQIPAGTEPSPVKPPSGPKPVVPRLTIDDAPAPPRKPAPPRPRPPAPAEEAVAPQPPARRRAAEPIPVAVEPEEVEEVEPEGQDEGGPDRPRRRRRKKRRRSTDGSSIPTVVIMIGIGVGFYLILVIFSVFSRAGAWALLIVGFVLVAAGQLWFMYIARQEDPSLYLLIRFVPFFSVYYFFTRINETYKPFILGATGTVFLVTGFIAMAAHGGFGGRFDSDVYISPPEWDVAAADREGRAQELIARGDKIGVRGWLADGRGGLAMESDALIVLRRNSGERGLLRPRCFELSGP